MTVIIQALDPTDTTGAWDKKHKELTGTSLADGEFALDVWVKGGNGIVVTTNFYQDQDDVALTNAYVLMDFGFTSSSFDLSDDSDANYIEWSWDGINRAGKLLKGDTFHETQSRTGIYLRGEAGNEDYRLWAR